MEWIIKTFLFLAIIVALCNKYNWTTASITILLLIYSLIIAPYIRQDRFAQEWLTQEIRLSHQLLAFKVTVNTTMDKIQRDINTARAHDKYQKHVVRAIQNKEAMRAKKLDEFKERFPQIDPPIWLSAEITIPPFPSTLAAGSHNATVSTASRQHQYNQPAFPQQNNPIPSTLPAGSHNATVSTASRQHQYNQPAFPQQNNPIPSTLPAGSHDTTVSTASRQHQYNPAFPQQNNPIPSTPLAGSHDATVSPARPVRTRNIAAAVERVHYHTRQQRAAHGLDNTQRTLSDSESDYTPGSSFNGNADMRFRQPTSGSNALAMGNMETFRVGDPVGVRVFIQHKEKTTIRSVEFDLVMIELPEGTHPLLKRKLSEILALPNKRRVVIHDKNNRLLQLSDNLAKQEMTAGYQKKWWSLITYAKGEVQPRRCEFCRNIQPLPDRVRTRFFELCVGIPGVGSKDGQSEEVKCTNCQFHWHRCHMNK